MTPREAILEIVKDKFKYKLRLGTIKPGSVSGGLCTVIPFDSEDVNGVGSDILEVRIQANPGNGIKPIPTDGSIVLIGEIAPFDYAILMYSALNSLTFMDGGFGGLTKTQELKLQLDKTNAVVNAIKNALTTWTPIPNDGGAALKTAAIAAIGALVVGDYSNIENSKITHG